MSISPVPARRRSRERRRAAFRVFQAAPRASIHPGASVPPAEERRIAAARSSASGNRLGVGAALEAVRGVGVEAQAARGCADRRRVPPRRFEQDVLRRGRHGGVEAAHDAGERDGALGVGNDDVGRVENPFDAVERHELFSAARLADDDAAAGELVEVEGVERLADVPEDVVGGVHGGADGLGADGGQPGSDALGGLRGGDPGDDAGAEAAAEARDFDGDGGQGLDGGAPITPALSPRCGWRGSLSPPWRRFPWRLRGGSSRRGGSE